MSTVETAKKKTKKAKKAKTAPVVGNGAGDLRSGEQINLGSDDALTMKSAQQAMAEVQQRLGSLREQYLAEETALLDRSTKARESFEGVLRTLAHKHGVDLASGQWTFNLGNMTFSRSQPQG